MHFNKMWPRYLLWFAQEHVDFRHAEIKSLLSMLNIPIRFVEKPCEVKPYWVVELPSEECVKELSSRSILLKNCIELWSRAKTESQLHQNLKLAINNDSNLWISSEKSENSISDRDICPKNLIEACRPVEKSFKVEVETFCKHFSIQEKVEKIEVNNFIDTLCQDVPSRQIHSTSKRIKFAYLDFEGPVKLKKPDILLSYIEFYGLDPNNVPEQPEDLFFGRWIADGQRNLIQFHSLKKRQFIGNTSMDAQLALLTANQAQVSSGDIVLDPFVGSGSLLVAAAHFGAYVYGSDIDYMMLHSKTRPTRFGQKVRDKEESIRSNMVQYGTRSKYLNVVVSDFSLPLWREDARFDAIITDPPYGVREATEKIGIDKDNYILTEEHLLNHVPAKVEYGLVHIYRDLLNFAARHLELGRRLVCWYPLVREEYQEAQLPSHPCLKLVANSEQVLSRLTARRLLSYEKTVEPSCDTVVNGEGGAHNFREKYFNMGEAMRQERRERKAAEIAAYAKRRGMEDQTNVT